MSNIFSIIFLFLLSFVVMIRQFGTTAYFACVIEDTYTFTSWAWQFTEALREGMVYPRWMPLDFWGYGSPTFVLYPPLAFYLVSFFNVLTHSIIVSMNMTKFAALFFSGMGMFFLIREFYSERVALVTALFYTVFPYNIFGLYLVGTFASLVSLVWFPPLFLFTYRYIKNRHLKDVLCAGACYGGLIVTHLINAYMFTFVVAAFVIYMSIVREKPVDLIAIPSIIFCGFLVAAAYVLPLIFERGLVNLGAFIGDGSGFRYSDFFILPDLTSKLPSDHFWPVYHGTIASFLVFFCVLIVLFFLQATRSGEMKDVADIKAVNSFLIGTAACSIFFLFGVSTFVWEAIPFFKYIQFPMRWLNLAVFAVVFLSAACFLSPRGAKGRYFIIAGLFFVCLLLDFRYIKYGPVFPEQKLMPVKGVNFTMEHLPAGVDVAKIDKGAETKGKVVITRGIGEVEILAWKSAERMIEIKALQPLTVRIRTFIFPGWTAYIDGARTKISTEEDTGAILVDIPEGRHRLELRFLDTPIRFYSKIISLASIFIFVSLAIFIGKKDNKDK